MSMTVIIKKKRFLKAKVVKNLAITEQLMNIICPLFSCILQKAEGR